MSAALAEKADRLLSLHQPGDPVVLPTVWDAWSATVCAGAGFAGLTIGSHPLAASVGRADNEGLAFDTVITRAAEITGSVDVPVSLDLESGYGMEPARLIDGLLEAGAVGCNLEDTVHGEGGRLRSPEEHADFIAAVRAAADGASVHVVINGRTDLFLRQVGDPADRFDRAVARLKLLADAGADVLYPVGRHDLASWTKLAAALPKPINAIAHPGQTTLADFAPTGVARISFGPRLQEALSDATTALLAKWSQTSR